MSNGGDFGEWYKNIPVVTKYWFTGSVIIPLAAKFGLVSAQTLVLFFDTDIFLYFCTAIFLYFFSNIFLSSNRFYELI